MAQDRKSHDKGRSEDTAEGRRLARVRQLFSGGDEDPGTGLARAVADESEPRVRCLASLALSALKSGEKEIFPKEVRDGLTQFRNLTPDVRFAVLESAAGPDGQKFAAFVLAALLDDENPMVWLRALKSLAACGGKAFLPWVATFLDSPHPRTVRGAIFGLATSGEVGGIYYLPAARHLEHHIVDHAMVAYFEGLERAAFHEGILRIPEIVKSGGKSDFPLLDRERARNLLGRIAMNTAGAIADAAQGVLAGMGLGDPEADLLTPGRITPPAHGPFDKPLDQKEITELLARAGRRSSKGAFETATTLFELESHIEANRLNALSLLEENGTMDSLEPIRLATHDRSRSVRLKATKVFVNLKRRLDQPLSRVGKAEDPALATLRGVLETGSRKAKVAALRAADLSMPGLLEFMTGRLPLEGDEHARAMMCTMAGMLGGPSVIKALVPLLKDPDDRVRANAVEGLIYTGDPAAFRFVIPMLRDGNQRVQLNIRNALKTLDPDSAMKLLTELSYSADEAHRLFSAYTLGLIGHMNTIIFVGLLKGMLTRETSPKVIVRIVKSFARIYSRYPAHIGRSALEKFMEGITDNIKRKAMETAVEALGLTDGAVDEKKWYDAVEEPLDPSLAFTRIINGTMPSTTGPASGSDQIPSNGPVPEVRPETHELARADGKPERVEMMDTGSQPLKKAVPPVAAAREVRPSHSPVPLGALLAPTLLEFADEGLGDEPDDTEEDFAWATTLEPSEGDGDSEKSRVFEALTANLGNPDPSVRGSALDSLRVMNRVPAGLIESVKTLVGDSDPMVRYRACRALKALSPDALAGMDASVLKGAGFKRLSIEIDDFSPESLPPRGQEPPGPDRGGAVPERAQKSGQLISPEPAVRKVSRPEPEIPSKPEPKASKPKAKEPKFEPKAPTKPEPKAPTKPEPKAPPKPEPKTPPQPEPKTPPQPEPKAPPRVESEPEVSNKPLPMPDPVTAAVNGAEGKGRTKTEPDSKSDAAETIEPPVQIVDLPRDPVSPRPRKPLNLFVAAIMVMAILAAGGSIKKFAEQKELLKRLAEARAEFLTGRKYEALELYLAAFEIDGNSIEALSGLAKCFYYTGRAQEAERAVDMIGRIDRKSPEYIDFIAMANLLEGKYEQAIEEYSRAVSINPGFTEARYGLALALKGAGFMEKAAEEAARVLSEETGHSDAMVLLAEIALSRGMTGESRVLLEKVLSLNPDHPQALRFLGLVHFKEGSFEPAIGNLEKAASVYSARGWPSGDIDYALGSALLASGRNADAVTVLKALVAKRPADNEARLNLAAALGRSGDVEGEKDQYREILSRDSGNPKPFYNLGIIYYNEGDLEASMKMFHQAVKLDPSMADGFFNIGVLNHRAGNIEEARKYYRRTLEISPGHPGATLGLKGVGG